MRRSFFAVFVLIALTPGVAALDVDAVRAEIARRGAGWTAGETVFTGLPAEELRRRVGLIPPEIPPDAPRWRRPADMELPDHFDWRDAEGADWLTPIRDQGLCAGCAAFGAIGALEVLVKHNELADPDAEVDLSEQHLFSCVGGSCQEGMLMGLALVYLASQGVPDEACFPYTSGENGQDVACGETCPDWADRARKIRTWSWVDTTSRDNIRAALLEGPLYVYILTYEDFYTYTGGIYEHVAGGPAGGHGVTLIGYDMAEEYWIGKNSWGTGWGEDGFFRIRFGDSEIETYVARMEYEPEPADDDDADDDVDDDTAPPDDDIDDDADDDADQEDEAGDEDDGCGC